MAKSPTELDRPLSAAPSKETPIFVMPTEFYGATGELHHADGQPSPDVPAPPAAPAPKPEPTPPMPANAPRKGRAWLPLALALLLVALLIGGAAAYYFAVWLPAQAPVSPSGPVCGDARCESGENYASCPADCEQPAPVCGDQRCEDARGESADSCPADCRPAGPVCGDGQCQEGEAYATCPADCEQPAPVCGDGVCDATRGEDYRGCSGDCPPPAPVGGPDLDSDGLTDREDREIFGTDVGSTDSDSDSFIDLNETLNLFDPARPSPAMLRGNPGVTAFTHERNGYRLLRPTGWSVEEDAAATVMRTAADESVRINAIAKAPETTLMDWYLDQHPTVRSAEVTVLRSKGGHEVIQTEDKLTAFVEAGNRVIELTYDMGVDRVMQYRSTFFMMVQSLEVLPVEFLPPAPPTDEAPAAPADEAAADVQDEASGDVTAADDEPDGP
jgi:hypothetical protein